MKKTYILTTILTLGLFLTSFAITDPVITGLSDTTFHEGSDPIIINPNVFVTGGGTTYGGGYVLFDLSNGDLKDQLGILPDAAGIDPNAIGVVSYSSGIFYLGNGTGKDVIASVDGVLNGENGNDLKINFSSNFPNPSFESSTTGWTIGTQMVDLGVTSIAGFVTPDDPTPTIYNNNDGDSDVPVWANYYSQISSTEYTDGNSSLRLYSSMTTLEGCDIVHGPYAFSSEFESSAGDVLQFDWRAYAGDDAYDVFGYLLNTTTGASVIVINQTGEYSGSTSWATANVAVPADGTYRFVFVSGTYDATCGRAAGASLYIDNFKVYGDKVTDALVTAMMQRVTYQNSCGTSDATRDLDVTVETGSGISGSTSSTISLSTEAPQPPTGSYNLDRTIEVENAPITITPDEVDPGYTDDCEITKSLSKSTFGFADLGVHNVTLTLTDTYGNTTTENFVVTVVAKYQPVITSLSDPTFHEGLDPIIINPNVLINNGGNYGGGYLLFDMSNGDLQDQLGISPDEAGVDPNAVGVITYSLGTFYLGNGTGKDAVASVDGILNGENGKNLKINFTSNFPNPSFEDNTTGWTIGQNQVDLGVTSILGFVTPDDPTNTPYNNNDGDSDIPNSASYHYQISGSEYTEGGHSLRLYSDMWTKEGCDIVHGPYAYSSEFESSAGDMLYFDWRAYAGSDAYDVFGYLLNTTTGASVIVINQTGEYSGSTSWATASVAVPTDGTYRFVFVSGTYDATCGQAAGASLYLDNFKVYGDKVNSDVATAIARRVTYQHTCGTSYAVRDLDVTVKNNTGQTATASSTITIIEKDAIVKTRNITVNLDANGNATITPAMIDDGSTNCGGFASSVLDKTTFTCADVGNNTVILTLTDNSGRTFTAEAIVKVVDNIIPIVLTRNVTVNLDGNGAASVTTAMIDNGSYDNCEIAKMTLSKFNFNCSNIGSNTVTLTVTDVNGNVNTRTAIVTVRDNTNPQLILVGPIAIQRVDGHYVKFDIRQLVDLVRDNADACAGNLTWAITKASSDEPDDAQGNDDGSSVNDIVIPGDGQEIEVRAESSIGGNGRVYTVYIEAVDASGNKTEKTLLITVNARGRYTVINDGPAYWVFSGAARVQANAALATTMMQNTPNPFKSTTAISFSLENDEYANLAIYSMAGQLIKTLVSEVKQAGNHTVVWEADDNKGELVPPGMYIYILKTKEIQYSKKIILLK